MNIFQCGQALTDSMHLYVTFSNTKIWFILYLHWIDLTQHLPTFVLKQILKDFKTRTTSFSTWSQKVNTA